MIAPRVRYGSGPVHELGKLFDGLVGPLLSLPPYRKGRDRQLLQCLLMATVESVNAELMTLKIENVTILQNLASAERFEYSVLDFVEIDIRDGCPECRFMSFRELLRGLALNLITNEGFHTSKSQPRPRNVAIQYSPTVRANDTVLWNCPDEKSPFKFNARILSVR